MCNYVCVVELSPVSQTLNTVEQWNIRSKLKYSFINTESPLQTAVQIIAEQYALESVSETFLAQTIMSVSNYELNKTKSSKHPLSTQRTLDCCRASCFFPEILQIHLFVLWFGCIQRNLLPKAQRLMLQERPEEAEGPSQKCPCHR